MVVAPEKRYVIIRPILATALGLVCLLLTQGAGFKAVQHLMGLVAELLTLPGADVLEMALVAPILGGNIEPFIIGIVAAVHAFKMVLAQIVIVGAVHQCNWRRQFVTLNS